MRLSPLFLILALAACDPVVVNDAPQAPPMQVVDAGPQVSQAQALRNFRRAAERIEPVAEGVCRRRDPSVNCDFNIVIDNRSQQINAYQTVDKSGRPIIAFTVPMIAEARNVDEIAFVMAHETAHHIEGHLSRQRTNATVGALVLGGLAGALGTADQATLDTAQQLGAGLGARTYSKNFELEADALGTRIAHAAGFDPLRGAQFFFRIPDPGDRFLGTHPANADRLRTVQRVAAGL